MIITTFNALPSRCSNTPINLKSDYVTKASFSCTWTDCNRYRYFTSTCAFMELPFQTYKRKRSNEWRRGRKCKQKIKTPRTRLLYQLSSRIRRIYTVHSIIDYWIILLTAWSSSMATIIYSFAIWRSLQTGVRSIHILIVLLQTDWFR